MSNPLLAFLQYFYKKNMVIFLKKDHMVYAKFRKTLEAWEIPFYVEYDSKTGWTVWRVEE